KGRSIRNRKGAARGAAVPHRRETLPGRPLASRSAQIEKIEDRSRSGGGAATRRRSAPLPGSSRNDFILAVARSVDTVSAPSSPLGIFAWLLHWKLQGR